MQRDSTDDLNNQRERGRAHRSEAGSPTPRRVDFGDDYDPHEHRQLPHPTNDLGTLLHLLRVGLGTGILAMPQAFAKAGLITGVISIICVAVLVTHCLQVLIGGQYGACRYKRVPMMPYPQAARVAFEMGPLAIRPLGKPSAVAIDVFIVSYQIGVCCVYIVFVADNLKKLCDPLYVVSIEMYMVYQLPVLFLIMMTPNLKILVPFSGVANLATVISLGIVIYYLVTMERSKEPLDLWGSISTFPLFFGTVVFGLTAVGVVVSLENNMKTPKSFGRPCGVLHIGMAVVTLFFIGIGYTGYTFCVSKCRDVITLDLPPGPPATVAIILYAFSILISYGLNFYVSIDILWNTYMLPRLEGSSQTRQRCYEILLRISLGIFTFLLAVSIPRLGLFISLFGALCLSALGFCFPVMMESCLWYPRPPSVGRSLMFLKDAFLFVVGIIGLVSGTYSAILGIVRSFQ